MFELYDFQQSIMAGCRDAYRAGHHAPLVVSPTGSGKTVMFSYMALNASLKGNNVLILVHRRELLNQTSKTLKSLGVNHGLIARGMSFSNQPVQVASVQTLVRRLHLMKWAPTIIVVDEAHHATGKSTWGKVLQHWPDARVLGVTATPERLDGRGLGVHADGFFDALVMGPQPAKLIEQGKLSQPVVYSPPGADLSGVGTQMGDFKRGAAAAAMDRPSITGKATEHYRRHCHGEPAIAFCCSIKHAGNVAAEFTSAGYQAACIDGTLDAAVRAERIADLGNGKLDVLTSCEIVSEGTDIPVVAAGILLRPTQSLAMYLQQTGRTLRPFPGKTHATILDHVGNALRHGLPDDNREWSLDAKKRSARKGADDSIATRQCDECFHVHRPAPKCPMCGYVYEVNGRVITEVAGDLERVDPDAVRRALNRRQARAKTMEELEAIAKQRGYKKGWAKFVYAARSRKQQQREGKLIA